MSIGAGIAVAGMWFFVAVFGRAKNVSNSGTLIAMAIAIGFTIALIGR